MQVGNMGWRSIVSGLLIIGMSSALVLTFVRIILYGRIFLIERNQAVLWLECTLAIAALGWGIYVCAVEFRRGRTR